MVFAFLYSRHIFMTTTAGSFVGQGINPVLRLNQACDLAKSSSDYQPPCLVHPR